MIRVVALLSTVAVLAGCGSGSSSSSSGCKDVPLSLNNEVSSSLATGFAVDGFRAVRSHDDKSLWFVSAHAIGPGGLVLYPTFATKNLGGGPVYVVDAASRNVTQGLRKLPGVSAKDAAVTDAQNCARSAKAAQ